MGRDAFSKFHPLVNFLFFAGAIAFGVLLQHPGYLAVGLVCAGSYYLLLSGKKGIKALLAMIPLFLFLTVINPLFNTYGQTVLFTVFGRPYTREALLYGAAVAGIFVLMLLWFGCYNQVMTGDKFTSLFGSLIPSISLLLVMVFRMVPNLLRKAKGISGARRSLGKGTDSSAKLADRFAEGGSVLGALTSWALEGSIVTGDSMRARGYGCSKRSSFMLYRITGADLVLLVGMPLLAAAVIVFLLGGSAKAQYTPELNLAPLTGTNLWGLVAYGSYLLIPTILHVKEAIQWRISRSKI